MDVHLKINTIEHPNAVRIEIIILEDDADDRMWLAELIKVHVEGLLSEGVLSILRSGRSAT